MVVVLRRRIRNQRGVILTKIVILMRDGGGALRRKELEVTVQGIGARMRIGFRFPQMRKFLFTEWKAKEK